MKTFFSNFIVFIFIVLIFIVLFSSAGPSFSNEMPGMVIINTNPQGAYVTRDDGIIEGLTPLEIILLEPGDHSFVFKLNNHLVMQKTLKVYTGTCVTYNIDLKSMDGMIACPHCNKLFDMPVDAPSKYKRGPLFKELNFLIYEGAKYLGPFNSGLLGFIIFENNYDQILGNKFTYIKKIRR
jgi:hypothetical protein